MVIISLSLILYKTLILVDHDARQHYSPGVAELRFDGKPTGLKNLLTVFDSGSSYTYLNSQAYQTLTFLVSQKA